MKLNNQSNINGLCVYVAALQQSSLLPTLVWRIQFNEKWEKNSFMENENVCKIELISLRCWFIVAYFAVVMVFGVTDSKAA